MSSRLAPRPSAQVAEAPSTPPSADPAAALAEEPRLLDRARNGDASAYAEMVRP